MYISFQIVWQNTISTVFPIGSVFITVSDQVVLLSWLFVSVLNFCFLTTVLFFDCLEYFLSLSSPFGRISFSDFHACRERFNSPFSNFLSLR